MLRVSVMARIGVRVRNISRSVIGLGLRLVFRVSVMVRVGVRVRVTHHRKRHYSRSVLGLGLGLRLVSGLVLGLRLPTIRCDVLTTNIRNRFLLFLTSDMHARIRFLLFLTSDMHTSHLRHACTHPLFLTSDMHTSHLRHAYFSSQTCILLISDTHNT